MSESALAGLHVLEVGNFMAAPFCTLQLADLGADVVKIENPDGGDGVRATAPFLEGESSSFIRLNRNKRSLALDLKAAQGKEIFRRLIPGRRRGGGELAARHHGGPGAGLSPACAAEPAPRLRGGLGLGAGRPLRAAARPGHHGAGDERAHVHHRRGGAARRRSRWAFP